MATHLVVDVPALCQALAAAAAAPTLCIEEEAVD